MAVTFTPYPDNRRNPMNPSTADLQEQVRRTKAALAVKLISENWQDGIVLANGYQYETEWNYGPARPFVSDGRVKTWWFNSPIEAVMPGRNPDDSFAVVPNTDSEPGLQWTTRELQDFYKLYRTHFPMLPKFVLQSFPAEEAGRAQFGNGPALDFPMGKILRNDPTANFRSTFPPGIGFRVNADGVLEWFKLSEYQKEYPPTGNGVPPLNENPGDLLGQASAILFSPGSQADKVAALRKLFR
jgi:hypothetical protein